jgi:hypothetical protein
LTLPAYPFFLKKNTSPKIGAYSFAVLWQILLSVGKQKARFTTILSLINLITFFSWWGEDFLGSCIVYLQNYYSALAAIPK